jgi:hypothetical protein
MRFRGVKPGEVLIGVAATSGVSATVVVRVVN